MMKSGRGFSLLAVLLAFLFLYIYAGLIVNAGLSDNSPGNVTGLVSKTGNFWINWTWDPSLNADDYDVAIDGANTGKDTTDLFYTATYYPHALKTIRVRAHNHSTSNHSDWTYQTTQIPNNPVTITNITQNLVVEPGQTVYVDADYLDADGDIPDFYCSRTDLFTDFNKITGVGKWTTVEAGVYYIDFGASDGYGSVDNKTMAVNVQQVQTPTPTPTSTPEPSPPATPEPSPTASPTATATPIYIPPPQSTSESGGGGGGSAIVGEPFENVADKEVQYIWTTIPGKEVTVQFKKPTHSILEINFVYSQVVDELCITVEKLINSSLYANSSLSGVIYENDNILLNVPNLTYISNVTIKFRVEKGWISANNIDPASISLYRFKDGVWNKLPADKLFENETTVIYIATTPGFSPFTIAGEKIKVSSPLQTTQQPTIPPTYLPAQTPISAPASMPQIKEANADNFTTVLSYIYIAVLIGGLIGFAAVTFLYYYTKPKPQS